LSDEEWRAYRKLLEIKGIASPGFARRVNLARELGLLTPLIEGDWEAVERVASESISSLSALIHSWCQMPLSGPELSVGQGELSDLHKQAIGESSQSVERENMDHSP
jgi:hypothetical protein